MQLTFTDAADTGSFPLSFDLLAEGPRRHHTGIAGVVTEVVG